jgi:hypothetical protein
MMIRSRIEALVGSTPAWSFSGADLLKSRQPCVYVWVRDDDVLYVGKGSVGIVRPLSSNHHQLQDGSLLPTDDLFIYPCTSGTEARIEQRLITELKPRYNLRTHSNAKRTAAVTRLTFNDHWLASAAVPIDYPGNVIDFWDIKRRGLSLRVNRKSGRKVFTILYREPNGKHRRKTLGAYLEIGLAEARRQATIEFGQQAQAWTTPTAAKADAQE